MGYICFYKIIDDKHIKDERHGNFNSNDLQRVWNDPSMKGKHDILLRLMIRFEICFQFQDFDRYIVPDLLNQSVDGIPNFSNEPSAINLEYSYLQFLPNSIISKFICRNHRNIYKELMWQYGVVLEIDNTIAIIKSDELDKKIKISVQGLEAKEVLYQIRKEFVTIHENSRNPLVEELVPCCCSDCRTNSKPFLHKYELLYRRKRKGITTVFCDTSDIEVSIDELTEGIIDSMVMNNNVMQRLKNSINEMQYGDFLS